MARLRSVLAIFTAMLISIVCPIVTTPASAVTAFTVSGTRTTHDPPFPEQLLPGYFTGAEISRVAYPAALIGMDRSIGIAVTGIERDLLDAAEPAIAAGFSQGAIAVAYAKKALMALSADQRPAPDRLTFVTIGDPTGAGGILRTLRFRVPLIHLTPFAPPDTPYDTVIVNGEYDGWADFPDRQWNLVSVVNALLGTIYVHGGYETIPGGLDMSTVPPANITTTVNSLGGTTTTYLLPTERLPLVQPLRDIGFPERLVSAIEKPLKRIVDKGYLRNDAAPAKIAQSTPPSTAKGPVTANPAPREIRKPERRAAAGSPRRTALRSSGRSAAAA